MNQLFPASIGKTSTDRVESRLLLLATGFMLAMALTLTFAPAARSHTWQVDYRLDHWIGFAVWGVFVWFLQRQAAYALPDRDPYLLPAAAILSGWGLLTIWRLFPSSGLRQTIWLALSLIVISVGLRLPGLMNWLQRYKYIWLTGGLILLAATFVFGTYPDGSGTGPRMWLGCCGIYLQPSEPLKLLLIIYLAAFLADNTPHHQNLARLTAPSLVLTSLALLLLVAQRDLGTASIFLVLYAAILYIATGRRLSVFISLAVILGAVLAGYYLFDVVRLRMDAWLNPWADPAGRSYQIVQSLISFASGGVFGKGIGLGSPGVVPVAQSDFILTAIAEETGLAGVVGVLAIIGLFAFRGLRAALRAPDTFQRSLAAGLTTFLAAQSILITGGNLRLLPLTGVTLPFISYGGSSLLTSFVCLMILLKISSQPELEPASLPRREPFLVTGTIVLAGLTLAAIFAGWWSVVRAPGLLVRNDNPRLSINDRYVPRGAILDRNGLILNQTQGATGSYARVYNARSAVAVTGYISPIFGRTGLEDSFDDTLRGLVGNTPSALFWSDLLYGQPPPGRDIRTSLNLNLQGLAYDLLDGQKGAAVLINAQSGEILVMASQPGFDPATLAEDWPSIQEDPDAPLVNRTAQGLYPAGTILAPFLFAEEINNAAPGQDLNLSEMAAPAANCLGSIPQTQRLGPAIAEGCRSVLQEIVTQASPGQTGELLTRLGFLETPSLPLEAAASDNALDVTASVESLFDEGSALVSPLQVALAAAALSNDGLRPVPRLVMAINDSQTGWRLLDQPAAPSRVFPDSAADTAAQALAAGNTAAWSALGSGLRGEESPVSWFVAGTLPAWQGSRLALVVLLESDNPFLARQIGEKIIFAAQGR